MPRAAQKAAQHLGLNFLSGDDLEEALAQKKNLKSSFIYVSLPTKDAAMMLSQQSIDKSNQQENKLGVLMRAMRDARAHLLVLENFGHAHQEDQNKVYTYLSRDDDENTPLPREGHIHLGVEVVIGNNQPSPQMEIGALRHFQTINVDGAGWGVRPGKSGKNRSP